MPIPVSCSCGRKFAAPDNLAGKAVKCPGCQQPLKIPAAQPAAAGEKIPTTCVCGASFAAGAHLAGKTVKCPKCQQPLTIPSGPGASGRAASGQGGGASQPKAAPAPAPQSSMDDFFDEIGVKRRASGDDACPSCGEELSQEAVICVHCGFDRRSGKKLQTTQVRKAPVKSLEAPIKKGGKPRKSKARRPSNPEAELDVLDFLLIIFCGGIALIIAIVRIVQGDPKGVKMLIWIVVIQIIAGVVGAVIGVIMGMAAATGGP